MARRPRRHSERSVRPRTFIRRAHSEPPDLSKCSPPGAMKPPAHHWTYWGEGKAIQYNPFGAHRLNSLNWLLFLASSDRVFPLYIALLPILFFLWKTLQTSQGSGWIGFVGNLEFFFLFDFLKEMFKFVRAKLKLASFSSNAKMPK